MKFLYFEVAEFGGRTSPAGHSPSRLYQDRSMLSAYSSKIALNPSGIRADITSPYT